MTKLAWRRFQKLSVGITKHTYSTLGQRSATQWQEYCSHQNASNAASISTGVNYIFNKNSSSTRLSIVTVPHQKLWRTNKHFHQLSWSSSSREPFKFFSCEKTGSDVAPAILGFERFSSPQHQFIMFALALQTNKPYNTSSYDLHLHNLSVVQIWFTLLFQTDFQHSIHLP